MEDGRQGEIFRSTGLFRFGLTAAFMAALTAYQVPGIWYYRTVTAVTHPGVFYGQWSTGGIPPFWSIGDIGQTRPREAPARAPDCPKFNSDALARYPQALPSTHTFSFFFSARRWG